LDGAPPFLPNLYSEVRKTPEGKVESRSGFDIEGFYRLIARLQEQYPEFSFQIEVDPIASRWIKYIVNKKIKFI